VEREFDFDSEDAVRAAKKSKEKKTGGRINRLKFDSETTGLVLLPKFKGKPFIKEVSIHQYWSNADRRFIVNVTSPAQYGEKDPIMDIGWKYREKYMDSDNKKLKDLWRIFMPKDHRYLNCLNVKKLDEGPLVADLPKIVFDAIMDEVLELEEAGENLKSIYGLDTARILKVKHNGAKGLMKKYEVVKFMTKVPTFIEEEKVDKEDLLKSMADLDKLEPVHDDAKIKEALSTLKKIARKIEEKETSSTVDDDEINNDFDDEKDVMSEEKSSSDDSDFDLD